MEAHVNSRMVGDVAVLDVGGELDLYTSPKLKAAIDTLLSEGHSRLLVNLTETTYLDSTALSILSGALKQVRDAYTGGNVGLIYNRPQIERMFSITGLNEVFAVFRTETEALEAARAWAKGPLKK
ncbi:MAG: STAS domain-containing protein [Armatimonadota bacterium]